MKTNLEGTLSSLLLPEGVLDFVVLIYDMDCLEQPLVLAAGTSCNTSRVKS